jgi:hypothetical protein
VKTSNRTEESNSLILSRYYPAFLKLQRYFSGASHNNAFQRHVLFFCEVKGECIYELLVDKCWYQLINRQASLPDPVEVRLVGVREWSNALASQTLHSEFESQSKHRRLYAFMLCLCVDRGREQTSSPVEGVLPNMYECLIRKLKKRPRYNNVESLRMPYSGMLRHVALVTTDVKEELSASIIRVTRIGELGTTLAVTRYRRAWEDCCQWWKCRNMGKGQWWF